MTATSIKVGDEVPESWPDPEIARAHQVTEIGPQGAGGAFGFRDLWRYRELLGYLSWRDILVRYKQAVLGVGWAVAQPIVYMIVFSIVFGAVAGLPSGGVPYPLFSMAALVPWQLFANSFQRAGSSIVANNNLVSKVYFPRLILPASAVVSSLVDFVVALGVLAVLFAYYRTLPPIQVLWMPALVLLTCVTALGVGVWAAALNVRYRDISYLLPLALQVWMYASPVAYSGTLVQSSSWAFLYYLNPMAGVIDGFRWCLLGTDPPRGAMAVSAVVSLVILATGLAYFHHTEHTFADVI